MYVIDNASITPAGLTGLSHRTLAGSANGLRALSVWSQTIEPGAGRGELHIDGSVQPFGPDCTIVLPANVEHQIVNSGNEPLKIVAALSMTPVQVHLPDGSPLPLPWSS